ncbi:purine nucleoside phosphorylase YfiH [Erwiniaceae bacterium BAC15a-03b]|uniref:Purine nucleoside phosphorylase n=1 Tax=Winslowiella arboricola TaxID=2978220 RepID=A0A9J6PLY4_9GAMM|nr:purine nucleoside phosphorylase YfiH [Winslowiella arboricola]MCU5773115.1 purine nucleoside phosphorylase YfiH [Winslowiella arboricola]MCU5777790.1 purine nucleoside phosphorylase YfiH [Winslowiella arboricola]
MSELIIPDWPAPANVRACSTTRAGGVSLAPWDALNLGTHVGDDQATVQANRERLITLADLPAMPVWLEQVHGTDVLRLNGAAPDDLRADAAWTDRAGVVCVAMTADCLPVLFCSQDGKQVAAAHAGWRGLHAGVLEATLASFSCPAGEIHAWLGPAIGPAAFEVGCEVFDAFVADNPQAAAAFKPVGAKYFADIWLLARLRLEAQGVLSISGGGLCTVTQAEQFFSFRRDGVTGRLASLIWLI